MNRRSWLYVPAHRERFVEKALSEAAADCVILDLEDGVPPAEKERARVAVRAALARPAGGPELWVRLNRDFEHDLPALQGEAPAGVCLSKVEESAEVARAAAAVGVPLLVGIETARGLLVAPALAAAHPGVFGLVFGAEDFALDVGMGADRDRDLLYARSAIVVAAAAARVAAVDGVFPDLDDEAGLEADARLGRRLGFAGKTTFNPRQLEVLNRVYEPAAEELEFARRVVEAYEAAEARGHGAVAVDGRLVDPPVVARARRLLR